MKNHKQELLQILDELQSVWTLAKGFHTLISFSDHQELIDLLYDILLSQIHQTKSDVTFEKQCLIAKKISQIKKEESLQQNPEDFLQTNIHHIL